MRIKIIEPDKEIYNYYKQSLPVEIVDEFSNADIVIIESHKHLESYARNIQRVFKGPIILASGDPSIGRISRKLGVCAITKPFYIDELQELISVIEQPNSLFEMKVSH